MSDIVYRDNAFGPSDFINTRLDAKFDDEKNLILDFINQDFDTFDREDYVDWVSNWKQLYLYITLDIKDLKSASEFKYVKKWQKLANTLLNARTYGKSVRRRMLEQAYAGA